MSPPANMPTRIFLLGRFEVTKGDLNLPSTAWTRRKAEALLQRLALEKRIIKDQVIDFLWPDASLSSGSNNLYRTLYALRQTIDENLGEGSADAIFSFNDGVLILNPNTWVDVDAFESAVQQIPQSPTASMEAMQSALDIYRGELLPDDPYSDWIAPYRARLEALHRELALKLCGAYERVGDFDRAIVLTVDLIKQDALDEMVQRQLIRLYALAGRRHDALRQYRTCKDLLEEELGVAPEPETEALYEQLLAGELVATPVPQLQKQLKVVPPPTLIEVTDSVPLQGREAELLVLRKHLDTLAQGNGNTLFICGETGVGKTRLAYALLQMAAEAGMLPLYGGFFEQEGQLPYQPFVEAINRFLIANGRPLTDNPIISYKPMGVTDPQQELYALFNSVVSFLLACAQEAPVLLLIDDLHAGDETSLHLFHYLARQTRQAPILLLATYRTDVVVPYMSPFNILLNALYREHLQVKISLDPLHHDAVARIISSLLGGVASSALVDSVLKVAEGNPFFVEETVLSLMEQGRVEHRDGQWYLMPGFELRIPSGLRGLMLERISQFGSNVVTALELGAIIGREFSFDLLREVSAQGDNELLDALDLALAGHVLEEYKSGYRFRHGFIRSVLYESQSQARRAQQHVMVARTIERLYPDRPGGLEAYAEALSYHYSRSSEPQSALPYMLMAGQKAANLYAFEVAIDYFKRALALMDEHQISDPAIRWQILEGLGFMGVVLANTEEAVDYFNQALALPPTETWEPTNAQRVNIHRYASVALITAGQLDEGEKHLRTAFDLIEVEDDFYAHALYNMAQLYWHRNDYDTAYDYAEQSLAVAQQIKNPQAMARAFEMLALVCHSTGDWQQGLFFEEQRATFAGMSLDVTEAFDAHL